MWPVWPPAMTVCRPRSGPATVSMASVPPPSALFEVTQASARASASARCSTAVALMGADVLGLVIPGAVVPGAGAVVVGDVMGGMVGAGVDGAVAGAVRPGAREAVMGDSPPQAASPPAMVTTPATAMTAERRARRAGGRAIAVFSTSLAALRHFGLPPDGGRLHDRQLGGRIGLQALVGDGLAAAHGQPVSAGGQAALGPGDGRQPLAQSLP